MNITQHLRNEVLKTEAHIPLSGVTSYHLLSGSLALANTTITSGFGTTLYTGNGGTQSINTGIDMDTQWGNSATEKFGGLVWVKSRSNALDNMLFNTVEGAGKGVISNSTSIEFNNIATLSAFTNTGFSLGNNVSSNTNLATYASWNFQTTHRTSGTTNHGKAYTCHYNPFTGFTIVQYNGSGLAGHEIPHHLGRKLGFAVTKTLTSVNDWNSQYRANYGINLNLTLAESANLTCVTDMNDVSTVVGTGSTANTNGTQYILYGWANSYFDESNTLIGNYEIGVYQGTGAAGNKVTTRGKPAWVMVKRVDSTGDWNIFDNQRISGANDGQLYANSSIAESIASDYISFQADGFTLVGTGAGFNASGGQYLYMVVYDNDSGSGKSKYPRATDTSNLNLNAIIPYANGIDASGTKITTLTKNETVSGLTLTQGKNYIWSDNTGAYGVKSVAPQYGTYNGFGDYFDVNSNKWYSSPSIFSDTMDTTTNWIADEATGGTASTISSVNGELKILNNGATYGAARRVETTVVGKRYRISISNTSSSVAVSVLIGSSIRLYDLASILNVSGSFSRTLDFIASTTTTHIMLNNGAPPTAGAISTWDNYAIYPINNDGSVDISSATPITNSRNYLDAIVYADAGGQPTYVEQLPKTEYKDAMQVDSLNVLGGFDLNQKWYNVTTSRVVGATYVNTSGKPKLINISIGTSVADLGIGLYIDGVDTIRDYANSVAKYLSIVATIPVGSTYSLVKLNAGTPVIIRWSELY